MWLELGFLPSPQDQCSGSKGDSRCQLTWIQAQAGRSCLSGAHFLHGDPTTPHFLPTLSLSGPRSPGREGTSSQPQLDPQRPNLSKSGSTSSIPRTETGFLAPCFYWPWFEGCLGKGRAMRGKHRERGWVCVCVGGWGEESA